jgi:NitT/TauT family transport system substrate-binding protein
MRASSPASKGILASLAAFALSVALVSPVGAADTTLRVATTPIDVGAEVYYAQEMGFFKKAGLDVQIQTISNGGAIAAAVASGAIDVGQGNVLSLIEAYRRGIPVTIVAPAGRYSAEKPTTQLVVAKSSTIRSAGDLNGKTVATNGLRNILELGTDAWSAKNGGDYHSLKFVEVPFPEMGAAVGQGRVQAAAIAEPSLAAAKAGDARVLGDLFTAIAPRWLIGAWFTTPSWVKSHPDLARRFDEVMRETAAWANANPERSAEILAKYTKVPLPVVRRMARSVYSERTDPAEIQPVIDAAAKFGFITGGFSASEMIAH